MPMYAITIGDKVTVIDAASTPAANAWARNHIDFEVRLATKADLTGVELSAVPSVGKGGKTAEEIAQEEVDAKEKAEKRAAKKAAA